MKTYKYLLPYPARRTLLAAGAAWPVLAWAKAVLAQPKKAPVLIGWLNGGSRETNGHILAAFKEGLAALGWKEGSQVVIEERWAEGRSVRLQPLAQELAAKKPSVIVAAPSPAVLAAAKAMPNTPVVQAGGGSVVGQGLAKSLARPGGMVTGVTNMMAEVSEKHLELLLAAAPKLRRIGFLRDPGTLTATPVFKEAALRAAARLSVEARFAEAASPEDIEPAISKLATEGAQALIVGASQTFNVERRRILKLALTHRWPVITGLEWAEEGALLTYRAEQSALSRRAAYYVDRILKGAKPGDLPIEQPTRFELVINMKTARALKLEISRELAVRADRVIE